jgi:hypothetical protein
MRLHRLNQININSDILSVFSKYNFDIPPVLLSELRNSKLLFNTQFLSSSVTKFCSSSKLLWEGRRPSAKYTELVSVRSRRCLVGQRQWRGGTASQLGCYSDQLLDLFKINTYID